MTIPQISRQVGAVLLAFAASSTYPPAAEIWYQASKAIMF